MSYDDRTRSRLRLDPGLGVLLAFLLLWGGFLIVRTSFVAEDGKRYFCLFDDAMISMTYARNLVEGHGLNWARQGDPVEGFTHPLWLVPMIAANLLPVELRFRSLPVQLVSLAILALLVLAVRRLVLSWFSGERARHWIPAAVMTAFCYSLAFWSLVGMETGLQALLAVVAVHLAIASVEGRRERHLELWAVCAAAYLARMDMLLLVLAVQAWVVARGGLRRDPRRWLLGLGLFLAVALGYELFRWVYFHDPLPNTWYLKMTGVPRIVRLLRGLLSFELFVRDHLLLLLAAGVGAVPLLRPPLQNNRRLELPAGIFLLYCAYSVWVGGDAWDLDVEVPVRANRFISFVLPLLFVLLNGVLNRLLDARAGELAGKWIAGAAAALGLILVNGLWPGGTDTAWRLMLGTQRPPQVESHLTVLRQLHRMQTVVRPGAAIATAWAGIPAYFSDYRMVDILGFNDRHVARAPSRLPGDEDHPRLYRPGHDRWDFDYLLKKVRPDAFFQVWGPRLEGLRVGEMMNGAGYRRRNGIWLKKGSPYVLDPPPGERPLRAASSPRRHKKRPGVAATETSPP
jgi:arabinofuranosyltransferase